ncbi:MAG: hypothetical protein AAGH41_11340 [Pseudomonadota bacterium]
MSENFFVADASTAFVLGNGPSLRGVDLARLPGPTFGMNAAYRYWRTIDWRPTHYACLDLVVGLAHRDAIAALIEEGLIAHFLLRANLIEALGPIGQSERVRCFEAAVMDEPLLADPGITTGSHTALWAASLGFRKLVLAGIDGRYVEIVPGAKKTAHGTLEIVAAESNPNYFFDGYQSVGDEYNVPNPRPGLHVGAFERAADLLQKHDVVVVNANPQSDVPYFPSIDLEAALSKSGSPIVTRREIPLGGTAQSAPQTPSGAGKIRAWIEADKKVIAIYTMALLALCALSFALSGNEGAGRLFSFALLALIGAQGLALLFVRRQLISVVARLDQDVRGMKHHLNERREQ